MNHIYLRKYGVETTINFALLEPDGIDLKTNAVHAAGDVKIMKDEGAENSSTNGFTDEGQGYSMVLTAGEMQATRIVLYIVDQDATKAWLDKIIVIETYGHANAQHSFALATSPANTLDIDTNGDVSLSNATIDSILTRPISNAEGSAVDRCLLWAIAKLVNKVARDGSTLRVKKTNDNDDLFTQSITTDVDAIPITEVDTD